MHDPQMKASTGVMAGTILLNGKFTELAIEKQLDGQHAVVHIADHFVMRPGDDSQSYLLMAGKDGDGAGYHLTVASFRDNQKMSLEGAELLTLPACDTGIGGSSANGSEVDGLPATAQRNGAKSMISSLWQINNSSTADLMPDFYKRWVDGGGKVTKVEPSPCRSPASSICSPSVSAVSSRPSQRPSWVASWRRRRLRASWSSVCWR